MEVTNIRDAVQQIPEEDKLEIAKVIN